MAARLTSRLVRLRLVQPVEPLRVLGGGVFARRSRLRGRGLVAVALVVLAAHAVL